MRCEGDRAGDGFGAAAEAAPVTVAGAAFDALREGALWWPGERLLVVADLHFEKGSSFARRGMMLPPYDTATTLARLGAVLRRHDPRAVVALGDSFHDRDGAARLQPADRAALEAFQRGRDWIWIAGNHDPDGGGDRVAGTVADELRVGPIAFRHAPAGGEAEGEIAGHLHPAARVAAAGGSVRRKCFVGDGARLVLPAFGAYAGGLNILDAAVRSLFRADAIRAFLLGTAGVYAVGTASLRAG